MAWGQPACSRPHDRREFQAPADDLVLEASGAVFCRLADETVSVAECLVGIDLMPNGVVMAS
jgi:hypothetical protein